MRTLKFRYWNSQQNIMFYPEHYDDFPNLLSKKDGWLQFTGLFDKSGKEIYEGDIVRNENDQKPNQEIIFAKGMFCLDDEDSPLWKYDPKNFWNIIGNIYENPNLLTNPSSPDIKEVE